MLKNQMFSLLIADLMLVVGLAKCMYKCWRRIRQNIGEKYDLKPNISSLESHSIDNNGVECFIPLRSHKEADSSVICP